MEPRIQYVKTSDGVNIACWVLGEGPPIVCLTNIIWSHAHLEWQFPEMRRWYEALAAGGRTVVRFDPRGSGLSQRVIDEYSVASLQRDLEAVADGLKLQEFALLASINGGAVAVSYCAHHPDRVSHLILWCAWVATSSYKHAPRWRSLRALQPLMDSDWETYTQTRARTELGWEDNDLAARYATFLQQCTKPQMAAAAYREIEGFDVSDLLTRVAAPTLVVHRRHYPFGVEDDPMNITAAIPGARLAVFEGTAGMPFLGSNEAELDTIREFLGDRVHRRTTAPPARADLPSGTAIILFADIVDSTALTERLGDDAFREKARGLDAAMRAAIRENGGTAVEGKTLGDGVLAVFTSAKQAIACARACHDAASAAGLALHAGIHAGDVIREADNVYGGAVNIAARVAAASAAGETLVSATVRELARTSAGVAFEDRGEQALKGVGEPVRVWAVREG
jgi:class 3 adenylate cyclase/pimeloyl-ACP methyl ester carboxylesterase